MSEISLKIKPTTGSPAFEVKVARGATISDLKAEVSKACDTPAELIRLIYKGQVLKDASTVESYGAGGAPALEASEEWCRQACPAQEPDFAPPLCPCRPG